MTEILYIGSLFVGAIVTYFSTKLLETKREIRKIKTDIYIEFIKVDTRFAYGEKGKQIEMQYAELEGKMMLYSNNIVIKRLAELNKASNNYLNNHNNLKNYYEEKEGRQLYANLIISMRKDIGLSSKFDSSTLFDAMEYFLP